MSALDSAGVRVVRNNHVGDEQISIMDLPGTERTRNAGLLWAE